MNSITEEITLIRSKRIVTLHRQVLDFDCTLHVAIFQSSELATLSSTTDISVEDIIVNSTGQTIIPSMLDQNAINLIMSWVRSEIIS